MRFDFDCLGLCVANFELALVGFCGYFRMLLLLSMVSLSHAQNSCGTSVAFTECSSVAGQEPEYGFNQEIVIRAVPEAFLNCRFLRTLKSDWTINYKGKTVRFEETSTNSLLLDSYAFDQAGTYEIKYRFYGKYGNRVGSADFATTATCYIAYVIRRLHMKLEARAFPCSGPFKLEVQVFDPNRRISNIDWSSSQYQVVLYDPNNVAMNGSFVNVSGSLYAIFPNFKPICDVAKYTLDLTYPDLSGKTANLWQRFSEIGFFSQGYIAFKCLYNCGTWLPDSSKLSAVINRLEPFIAQADENPSTMSNWTWTISEKNMDAIRLKFTKPHVLNIKKSSLDPNTAYKITANKGKISGTYDITTASLIVQGHCSVQPKTAELGSTFVVSCTGFRGIDPLFYEIGVVSEGKNEPLKTKFIKGSNSATFSLIPPSNNLIVKVTDSFTDTVEVKVSDFQIATLADTDELLERLLVEAESAANNDAGELATELLSVVALIAENKKKLTPQLKLRILSSFGSIKDLSDSGVKSGIATLLTLCTDVDRNEPMQDSLFLFAGIVANKLSSRLIDISRSSHRAIHPINTTWTSMYLLSAVEEILKLKDPLLLDPNADEYTKTVHTAKVSSGVEHVRESILRLSSAIAEGFSMADGSVSFGVGGIRFNSKMSTLSQISGPEEEQFPESKVKFPDGFTQQFAGTYEHVFVAEIQLPNMFWWKKEEVNSVDAVIVDVKGFVGDKSIAVNRSQLPITVQMDVKDFEPEEVEGAAVFPPMNASQLDKDHYLSVHRLHFADPIGFLVINFQGSSILNELKVKIDQDHRSEFDAVYQQDPLESSTVPFRLVKPLKKSFSLVYVSILPAKNDSTVNYKFTVRQVICKEWVLATMITEYCQVVEKSVVGSSRSFSCSCHRFTTILGNIFVPPNRLEIWRDIQLFSMIHDNFYVVSITGLLFLIFTVCLIYFLLRDRRIQSQAVVTYLEDNDPRDTYPYLVGVQTGRFLTPTPSPNVAFYFHGTNAHSKVHVMKSLKHKVLRPGSEDWFLVFSRVQIKDVKMIRVWHDDTGKFPFWFCNQITLVDVISRTITNFYLNDWVSVHTFKPNSSSISIRGEVRFKESPVILTFRNVYLGFRELHRWFRLIARHPRSRDSVAERLSKTYTMIIVMMLINMLFFGVQIGPADYPSQTMKLQQFIISLESLAISMIVVMPILMIFEMSKKEPQGNVLLFSHLERKRSLTLKNPLINHAIASSVNTVTSTASNAIFPPSLKPLSLMESAEPDYYKKTRTIAWVVSSVVNVSATFFVMLYGLHFGKNKSVLWLATFLCGLANDAFVVQPVKILTFSLVAALLFKGSTPDRVLVDQVKQVAPVPATSVEKREMLKRLCHTRLQPMYKPLDPNYVEETRFHREILWMKILAILQLSVVVGFILPIFFFVDSLNIYSEFVTTALVTEILKESCNGTLAAELVMQFLPTRSDVFDYVAFCFLPSYYKTNWYNGKPLSSGNESQGRVAASIGRSIFESNILYGVPRIRQQRVKPLVNQTIPSSFRGFFADSYGHLTRGNEDKSAYTGNWRALPAEISYYSEWIYSDNPEDFISLHGKSGIFYTGGGYIVDLDHRAQRSISRVTDLYMKNWIDNRTRVIVLEANIYAFQTRRFRTIYLMIEMLPNGLLSSTFQIDTVNQPDPGSQRIATFVAMVLLVALIIPVCYLSYAPVGLLTYLTSFANLIELAIVIVGIVFLVFYFYEEVNLISFEYELTAIDEFHTIRELVENESVMFVLLGTLCILVFLRISYLIFKVALYGSITDNLLNLVTYLTSILLILTPLYAIVPCYSTLFCARIKCQLLSFHSRGDLLGECVIPTLILYLLDVFVLLTMTACTIYVVEFYRQETDEKTNIIPSQGRMSRVSFNYRGGRIDGRKIDLLRGSGTLYRENVHNRSLFLEAKMTSWNRKTRACRGIFQ